MIAIRTYKVLAYVLALTGAAAPSLAQQPAPPRAAPAQRAAPSPAAPAAAPKQVSSSPTATLYRVDEGIFDIREGQTLDLTDRKILMAFRVISNAYERESFVERKQVRIYFSGAGRTLDNTFNQGQRLDLKNNTNYYPKLFADKAECYLDLIDTAAPKGGTLVATFRFVCS